jgi:hypothetical protein
MMVLRAQSRLSGRRHDGQKVAAIGLVIVAAVGHLLKSSHTTPKGEFK